MVERFNQRLFDIQASMRRQHPCCRESHWLEALTPSSKQYRAYRLAYEACIYEKSLNSCHTKGFDICRLPLRALPRLRPRPCQLAGSAASIWLECWELPPSRVINAIRGGSRTTVTTLYNCRLLDKKVRQMRSVDLGMGAWCCFRDFGVNKSNTRDMIF